jgi:hypothetical protein
MTFTEIFGKINVSQIKALKHAIIDIMKSMYPSPLILMNSYLVIFRHYLKRYGKYCPKIQRVQFWFRVFKFTLQ